VTSKNLKDHRAKALFEAQSRKKQADEQWAKVMNDLENGNFDKQRILNAMIASNQADFLLLKMDKKL